MTLGTSSYGGWYSMQNYEESFGAQKVYPTLAEAILVTTHADDFTLGSYAILAAANEIDVDFHIHHVHIIAPSANAVYELVLYAETTEIGRCTFSKTDKKDDIEGVDLPTIPCDANTKIQAKLSNNNDASEDTTKIIFWYHPHNV